MAHNRAYLICENKCLVDGIVKDVEYFEQNIDEDIQDGDISLIEDMFHRAEELWNAMRHRKDGGLKGCVCSSFMYVPAAGVRAALKCVTNTIENGRRKIKFFYDIPLYCTSSYEWEEGLTSYIFEFSAKSQSSGYSDFEVNLTCKNQNGQTHIYPAHDRFDNITWFGSIIYF